MSDMAEYKRALKSLADSESSQFINNGSMDHAAAMIEELFRNAKGRVCILTDHLHPDVYNRTELKKVAADFLNQDDDNEIYIAVQLKNSNENVLYTNGFIASLSNYKDKVKIFKTSNGNLKDLKNHFMVTKTSHDNYALRFETDITMHTATGTFNGGADGEKLFNFFQRNIGENTDQIQESLLWR